MKTYEAIYMPATPNHDPSKGGFKTEDEAWEYVASFRCESCASGNDRFYPCDAEWAVDVE